MAERKPYLLMLLVQFIFAGMAMVSKAAFNGGMNTFVYSFYRQAIAAVIWVPIALIFGRKTAPPLTFKILIKIFLLTLLGYTITLNLHSLAINYTSATVTSATNNLMSVFTFVLAILFRMEFLKLKSISGIAKINGVVLCLIGVMLIAFYKGPHLKSLNHHHPILHGGSNSNHSDVNQDKTWILGTFLMVFVAFGWASWMVLQGILLREYPSMLWSTMFTSLFSAIQTFLVAIAFERDMSKWKLELGDGLLAVAYNGVLVAGLITYLHTWCIDKKGPVFVTMFTPLSLIITITCSSFVLGEVINLGSVLGGAFLVGGLYSVLWGKSREGKQTRPNVVIT